MWKQLKNSITSKCSSLCHISWVSQRACLFDREEWKELVNGAKDVSKNIKGGPCDIVFLKLGDLSDPELGVSCSASHANLTDVVFTAGGLSRIPYLERKKTVVLQLGNPRKYTAAESLTMFESLDAAFLH